MNYNFDQRIDRTGTRSVKWDRAFLSKRMDADDDVLPLWVADMDFAVPDAVVKSLRDRVDHGIFGYPFPDEPYYEALKYWQKKRHGWDIQQEWVTIAPGIVPALSFIIRSLTEPGDGVIIQEPVYAPFRQTIEAHGRKLLNNKLVQENGRYEMDFDDLERKAGEPGAKLLILCSPHNPVGRVWEEEELRRVGEICRKHGILVVADEIHEDLVLPGSRHISYATLGPEYAGHSIICTAPSKTFNIAGLQNSNLIIPDKELKERIDKEFNLFHVGGANVLGMTATTAAYSPEGEEWLDQLLSYLDANADFIQSYLTAQLPEVRFRKPEGTYLAWLDFSSIVQDSKQLERMMKKEAKVLLNPGAGFGEGGAGFMRLNFGCAKPVLEEALGRIVRTFKP